MIAVYVMAEMPIWTVLVYAMVMRTKIIVAFVMTIHLMIVSMIAMEYQVVMLSKIIVVFVIVTAVMTVYRIVLVLGVEVPN